MGGRGWATGNRGEVGRVKGKEKERKGKGERGDRLGQLCFFCAGQRLKFYFSFLFKLRYHFIQFFDVVIQFLIS